jgi:hypothetical protein
MHCITHWCQYEGSGWTCATQSLYIIFWNRNTEFSQQNMQHMVRSMVIMKLQICATSPYLQECRGANRQNKTQESQQKVDRFIVQGKPTSITWLYTKDSLLNLWWCLFAQAKSLWLLFRSHALPHTPCTTPMPTQCQVIHHLIDHVHLALHERASTGW